MNRDINTLIKKIREEERKKIMEEIEKKENKQKPWESVSEYIDSWGEQNGIYQWHLHKIKNAIYTIVRYSLEIDRMAQIEEEQLEMAIEVTKAVLEIVIPMKVKKHTG